VIAFVDDDCVLSPGWVREAARFFREHPRAGVVGGRVALRWEEPPAPWLLDFAGSFAHQDHGPEPVRFPERGVVRLVGAGFVCRREALAASGWLAGGALVGREGTTLTAGEDIELVLRIREAGWEAWYAPGLSLEHFIPRRRMEEDYVRRLHRGFGRARVPLHFIETRQAATSSRLLRAVAYALRELASCGAAALLARGDRERVRSRVAWQEALGKLEGAWTMLRDGHRP